MKDIRFIAIAAVSTNGVIGVDNEIPWRIPEDFKHFRTTTMGSMLLVGYNTYITLPEKAFEGRQYIVLSKNNLIKNMHQNVYQFKNLNFVMDMLRDDRTEIDKIFVAGGAMIYNSLIDYCDMVIITWINKFIPNGNKFFPIDKLFTNFVEDITGDWKISISGEQYKITVYGKKI